MWSEFYFFLNSELYFPKFESGPLFDLVFSPAGRAVKNHLAFMFMCSLPFSFLPFYLGGWGEYSVHTKYLVLGQVFIIFLITKVEHINKSLTKGRRHSKHSKIGWIKFTLLNRR